MFHRRELMSLDHCSNVVVASKEIFTPFTKNVGVPGEVKARQYNRRQHGCSFVSSAAN
jgi:hypothetical protein